jgi:alpha-amylase/alpha-mannosidase (GH57 family)
MDRYVCIHGHFYQPPRENPWLEEVELQDSAYPFHDWNVRVTEECYKQNMASRILGSDRKIIDIVNNYTSISFNFGPTLLRWLQSNEPEIYEEILEADIKGQELFSGHGPAIAQPYTHIIMPLANKHDKQTQVIWGISDFELRFGRKPEGMWLPETAVDTQTLEVLAENDIKFTILSPHQAAKVRAIESNKWNETNESQLDTTMPYICNLPSGKSISIFFYNGKVSRDVAYGRLLESGYNFAIQLSESFNDKGRAAQLVHIATDGESFGHHHRFADMALAFCMHHIRTNNLAKVTIYAEFLEKFPPTHEVQIVENTSWSCAHGVERWRSNCGCSNDKSLAGRQQWREPLRKSMDWLRDRLCENYESSLSRYCRDPWQVRNEYMQVINDRSEENVDNFIARMAEKELPEQDKINFLKLMEMQRMAMLMYTSCGWFFDNITGIETIQVMRYASRAMQLYQDLTKSDLVGGFKAIIKDAPASLPDLNNGKDIYEKYVEPAKIDLYRVGAHFALSSIFTESLDEVQEIFCYTAVMKDYKKSAAGPQKLATGRASIKSNIVREQQSIDFATLHIGGHNLFTALTTPFPDNIFEQTQQELEDAFYNGDTNEVMRQMNIRFGPDSYSIWHLFKDEQRRIVYELLSDTWEEVERSFRHIYQQNYAIMLMLVNMNMNLPKALAAPAEFILNRDLCEVIEAEEMDITRLKELTDEAARLMLKLDIDTIRYEASTKINNLMEQFEQSRDDLDLLFTIESSLKILKGIVPDMDLQSAQNQFFMIAKENYPEMKERTSAQDKEAQRWVELFELVAVHLNLVIE